MIYRPTPFELASLALLLELRDGDTLVKEGTLIGRQHYLESALRYFDDARDFINLANAQAAGQIKL